MTIRITTLAVLAALVPFHVMAQGPDNKQGWAYSIGAGAIYSPTYLGDDESQLSMVPNLRISYEDKFFASMYEGIGYNVINTKAWKAGPIVKYDFGRDEDGDSALAVSGGNSNDLIGLGDVDGSLEVGAYVQHSTDPITTKLEIRQGLGGHEGLVGEVSVDYGGATHLYGQRFLYAVGPKVKYTDGHYNEAFFGVNAAQSAASGLNVYDADEPTLSYGIGGSMIVPHTDRVSTILFANYTKLGDEIADSSLVKQRGDDTQATVGLLVNYSF